MSKAHSHNNGGHGAGDADHLHDMALGKIVIVGLASLALFAAGIVWSYFLLVGKEGELTASGAAKTPAHLFKEEIGIVDQVPFDIDNRLQRLRAADAKRLAEYGWIDRAKGIARMPIEKAMQQVVAQPPDIAEEGVPPAARAPMVPSVPVPEPSGGKSAASKSAEGGKR